MPTCPTCRTQYPEGTSTCAKDGDGLLPDVAFAGLDRELEPGFMVGEYRIEGKIGEGGFGSVYRAVHPLIGKTAAIKVLSRQYSSNPQVVSRFIAEARAVNQIRHRNIIDIFSFGALDDGRQYFVMELLDGMPLDRYLKDEKGRLSPEEAIPILRGVARALDAAHLTGILHRDLKPENIFLSFDEDGRPFPKLLDFGIAKLVGAAKSGVDLKTRTGTPMGTPYYMSPEQCRGKEVDHRTDIYSFGVLTHELLTGDVPFQGADVVELLMKQTREPPPPMSSMCAAVPAALDAPVLQMLAKEPEGRPASVGAALDALAVAARAAGFDVPVALASGPNALRTTPRAPEDRVATPRASDERLGATTGAGAQDDARNVATIGHAATIDESLSTSQREGTRSAPTFSGASDASAASAALVASGASVAELSSSPSQTFGPAASDVRAGRAGQGRRSALVGVVGFGVVALVLIALVATGVLGGAGKNAASAVPAPVKVEVTAKVAPATASPASSAPAAPTTAVETKDVLVTIDTTPAHAAIWRDGVKLGEAPGPIALARSSSPTKLLVTSDGYKPSVVTVGTTENATIAVALTKIERPAARPAAKAKTSAAAEVRGEIPSDINEK
ncbi:serine/threonine-protein kinase [Pendulispora albinea]|uniref:Serine/threonine protein kinase n=1 Tax=Pendulispora albinea TaxID=2741071 RepID=A0ABZ2LP02_9BACT